MKIEKYFGLVTPQAIYFIERKKVKKQFIMSLVERIPWSKLTSIGMSTLADNWITIQTSLDTPDFLVENDKKTEFLTIVNDQFKAVMRKDVDRVFNNTLEYVVDKKKKTKKSVTYSINPEHKLPVIVANGSSKFS